MKHHLIVNNMQQMQRARSAGLVPIKVKSIRREYGLDVGTRYPMLAILVGSLLRNCSLGPCKVKIVSMAFIISRAG